MNPLENFDRAAATVGGIIGAIRPEQLGVPTACTDWSVRDVINHVVQGNLKTVAWAHGTEPPPDADHLGSDPPGAFARSLREVRATLGEPGLFERMVTTPIGTAPGALLVHLRVNEYLAHAWDIADATGQPTDFAPDLAEQALADWQQRFGATGRSPGGPFAGEKPAPRDGSAADRLAAFLGRESVRRGE
ncbi:TIGR03086 family protein [Amycolatopsis sp. K13G38]|uniref:TIGR03086 family protein n=1 Tax=Amycolatopsis acididurans TaxID=2724524 RepID=A0ABX1J8A7_9PSEU|nr:TIGR03086 family metal-binding protein [Amycolatopsis acididurans]NKQ55958.1 TIGR03086 family protein [Amycolatopsis acididurans]